MHRVLLLAIGVIHCSAVLAADVDKAESPFRIATWNVNNLADEGVQAQSRAPLRKVEDFNLLRFYAQSVDADIIALQEVASLDALKRVFPPNQYRLYLSPRKNNFPKNREFPGIFTAYAVKQALASRVSVTPYSSLGLRGLRWGLELNLRGPNKTLALLNVHLKSGCAFGSLKNSSRKQCDMFKKQVEPLERWVDEQVKKQQAFLVLGDFNRAIDKYSERDHFWQWLDDNDPQGMDLERLPYRQGNRCWEGSENHYSYPVDFFVFDKTLLPLKREDYEQYDYSDVQRDVERKLPSDHCAAVVEVNL